MLKYCGLIARPSIFVITFRALFLLSLFQMRKAWYHLCLTPVNFERRTSARQTWQDLTSLLSRAEAVSLDLSPTNRQTALLRFLRLVCPDKPEPVRQLLATGLVKPNSQFNLRDFLERMDSLTPEQVEAFVDAGEEPDNEACNFPPPPALPPLQDERPCIVAEVQLLKEKE